MEEVSAKRISDILDWAQSVLGAADAAAAQVDETHSSIKSLEMIRRRVEQNDRGYAAAVQEMSERSGEYELLATACEPRFGRMVEHVDAETVSDVQELGEVLAELGVPLGHAACSPDACLRYLLSFTAGVASSRAEAQAEEAEATLAGEHLVEDGQELRQAWEVYTDGMRASQRAEEQAALSGERAGLLRAKAAEYSSETKQLKGLVRASGVTEDTTHDAVLASSIVAEGLEATVKALDAKLAVFCGLPANEKLARERLASVEREIAGLDQEISSALSKLVG